MSRNKTLLKRHGYIETADRIFRRVTGKVMYGRPMHVYYSPSTDEIQMRVDGIQNLHDDAVHVQTYRALKGRDDLRPEHIEDDLLDLLKRMSVGAV